MKTVLMVLALVLGLPGGAAAGAITLEDAVARALQVDPEIQVQALSSEAAEARWLADPRAGSPSIRLGVRDLDVKTSLQPTPRDPEYQARLRMPLPRPWDLATASEQGEATVARDDAQLAGLQDDVRLAVTVRARTLPLLRQAAEFAAEIVALRAEHVVLVARRRAEGLATALDWLDSEEQRRDADERRAAREAEALAVEAELRAFLQWPAEDDLDVVVPDPAARAEEAIPPIASLEVDPETAAVREANAEIARAEARLRRQQLDALPWLDWVQGGAAFQADSPVAFDVTVAIDVPIYLWSPARTRAAARDLQSAKLRLSAIERSTSDQLARRHRRAQAAQERWRVEQAHRDAIIAEATPLLELADPVLKLELRARIARSELRVLLATVELLEELDRLEAAR